MTINRQSDYYHIEGGGAVPIHSPSYVCRQADEDLYNFAYSDNISDFICYVLAPRQMGKSSLKVHVSHRLMEQFICISIDFQNGFNDRTVTDNILYRNILHLLCQQLPASVEGIQITKAIKEFWNKYLKEDICPAIIFQDSFQEIILPKVGHQRIIIFIDEIQNLLRWKLNNNFLAMMKAWSEANKTITNRDNDHSKEKANYHATCKLKFVLLGVVKPYDLLTNAAFNIGKPIELENFAENTEPLVGGLTGITEYPEKVLKEILWWTGGHPFLTQLVCSCVSQGSLGNLNHSNIKEKIEGFVKSEIIHEWRSKESKRLNHFSEVERWFTQGYTDKAERVKALQLYDRILCDNQLIRFNSSQPECMSLLISGLVSKRNQYLKVSNPIYQTIFNLNWSKETQQYILDLYLPKPEDDIYDREILDWITSYEKAIVARNFQFSKQMIDAAFYELVDRLAEKFDFSEYTEPKDRDIHTVVPYCIDYLAENLVLRDIWNQDDRPNIKQQGENRWKITVSNCSYQEECKWAKDESAFVDKDIEHERGKYKKYRCQRLGCCVGALKKYMSQDVLTNHQREKLDYSMETVIDDKGCQGFIFIKENL